MEQGCRRRGRGAGRRRCRSPRATARRNRRSARAGAAGRRPSARRRRPWRSCRPAAMAISLPKLRLSDDRLERAILGIEAPSAWRSVPSVEPSSTKMTSQSRPRPSSTGRRRPISGSSPALLVEHGHDHREERRRGSAARLCACATCGLGHRQRGTSRRQSGRAGSDAAFLATRVPRGALPGQCRAAVRAAASAGRHDAGIDQAAVEGEDLVARLAGCSSAPCTAAISRLRSRCESDSGSPARSRMTVPR